MPEFSACYFCGTALDDSLAEYPVVPKALHPTADEQRTVVLCPSCRRKLGAVVDTVIQAVDDSPNDDSIQGELDETTADASADDDADGNITVERLDSADGQNDSASSSSGISSADPEPTEESSLEESGFEFAGDADDSDQQADAAEDRDPSEQTDPAEPAEPGEPQSTPSGDDSADGIDRAEDSNEEEPEMTALEYNKVMRLLQNREFPVDREEFKVVATNAYEIGDDEFDAVIEAAAKRDLIGIDGDQIVEA